MFSWYSQGLLYHTKTSIDINYFPGRLIPFFWSDFELHSSIQPREKSRWGNNCIFITSVTTIKTCKCLVSFLCSMSSFSKFRFSFENWIGKHFLIATFMQISNYALIVSINFYLGYAREILSNLHSCVRLQKTRVYNCI